MTSVFGCRNGVIRQFRQVIHQSGQSRAGARRVHACAPIRYVVRSFRTPETPTHGSSLEDDAVQAPAAGLADVQRAPAGRVRRAEALGGSSSSYR
ncbi:hypothetical protein G6F31_012582 [Rhizopus arrhizus]|nr:hypothetical protein G6F31_012582 [Rhizopus arrhizus]